MFENFAKFFAQKKNMHIFVAALVILGGIFFLKRTGLYEGLENASASDAPASDAPASGAPASDASASTGVKGTTSLQVFMIPQK
jgi:hypothetical protein